MGRDPQVGDAIRVRDFSLDDVESDITTCTVEARTTEVVEGIALELFAVATASDREGETGTSRLDARGRVLSMEMGGFFEIRLEPEAIAKQIELGADLFMSGTVEVDEPLGEAPKVRRLVLEVQGEALDALIDAPRQKVVVEGGKVLLHLGDVHPDGFPATEEEIERSLPKRRTTPSSTRPCEHSPSAPSATPLRTGRRSRGS